VQDKNKRDWKITDESAGLENGVLEIDWLQFSGLENAGLEYDGLRMCVWVQRIKIER